MAPMGIYPSYGVGPRAAWVHPPGDWAAGITKKAYTFAAAAERRFSHFSPLYVATNL